MANAISDRKKTNKRVNVTEGHCHHVGPCFAAAALKSQIKRNEQNYVILGNNSRVIQ